MFLLASCSIPDCQSLTYIWVVLLIGSWTSSNIFDLASLKGNAVRVFRGPSSFWFERLVEGARRDEGGGALLPGHWHKYKSARGADVCCHVGENTEGLHMRPHLLASNIQRGVCVCVWRGRIFGTGRIGEILKVDTHTLTHSHPFLSPCGRTQLQMKKEKSKQSHSLNCTQTVESLSKCRSRQSHPRWFANAQRWRKALFISPF